MADRGNDYEQQSVSTWRLRELLQHEKDNAELRRRIEPLVALLREARREHHRGDDQTECTTWYSDKRCNCGAEEWNARIDEALK